MNRPLPIVDIADTSFYVDVMREELRQTNDPENRISFNVLDQNGNGYTFLYDLKAKNVPESPELMEDSYQWITLPALMELDPEGIALKYHIPLEVLCPELTAFDREEEEDDSFNEDLI